MKLKGDFKPRGKDWLITTALVIIVVLFFAFIGGQKWYCALVEAAGDTFWARLLLHGVPSGMGAATATLYLTSLQKKRKDADQKEKPE